MIFFDPAPHRQQQIRTDFKRLMAEQLPEDERSLSALSAEEIVSRLCDIYEQVTGDDVYSITCRAWCGHKLLS